jgi:hypothetical protein
MLKGSATAITNPLLYSEIGIRALFITKFWLMKFSALPLWEKMFSVTTSIVWEGSICAGLPRWVLEFGFQVSISLEYGTFEKLNRLNWI